MKKSFKDVIKTKLMTRVLCVVYCGSIFYSCHVQSLSKKNKKSYVSEEYLRQAEACMIITNQTPYLRNDTVLLPQYADICLQCFFNLGRKSYVSTNFTLKLLNNIQFITLSCLVPLSSEFK